MELKGYVRIFFPYQNRQAVETVYVKLTRLKGKLIWEIIETDDMNYTLAHRFTDYTIHVGDFHSIDWSHNWGACFISEKSDKFSEINYFHLPFEEHHINRCWGNR